METVVQNVAIRRSPEEVFAFVADFTNDSRWRKGVRRVNQTNAGVAGMGTAVSESFNILGQNVGNEYEVIAFEPGREVRLRSTSAPEPLESWRQVEAVDGGTRLTWGFEVATGGPPVAEGLVARYLGRQARESVAALKELLEQGGKR